MQKQEVKTLKPYDLPQIGVEVEKRIKEGPGWVSQQGRKRGVGWLVRVMGRKRIQGILIKN